MRKKFISFVSLTLAAIMSFGLTACGPKPDDKDKNGNNTDVTTTYRVTYNYNYDDAENETASVTSGNKVSKPQTPEREGHTFVDWYKEQSCENAYSFDTVVNADITLYAKWNVNQYTVTLNHNYTGSQNSTLTVNYGEQVAFAEDPVRTGYAFDGWYTEEQCTNLYNYGAEVKNNLTLYAKWAVNSYTVTLDYNYDNETHALNANYGEKVSPEADPVREGYTFGGWFKDKECTQAFSFDNAVTQNVTVYAKWAVNSYTVTVNYNHDGLKDTNTVAFGGKVTKPADPVREGYTFGGWCSDAAFTKEYSFDSAVKGDVTIYAKWIDDTKWVFAVEFDPNFTGVQSTTQNVEEGGKAVRPADPVRTGYTLTGWFTDKECTQAYSFDTAVTAAVKLYAGWTLSTYTVSFDPNFEEEPATTVNVAHGGLAEKPADPVREGYTFGGWFKDRAMETEYVFTAQVTSDITLFAKWTLNVYTVTFNPNYDGEELSVKEVSHGSKVAQQVLTRTGYSLDGWFTDEACANKYDFTTAVTGNITLYAKWTKTGKTLYVFEAEDTYLDDIEGKGYSNDAYGTDCIQKDQNGAAGASGGFFVGYLYKRGVEVPFDIYSDRDTDDARLTLRISCELNSVVELSSSQFQIILNGEPLSYNTVKMENPYTDISIIEKRPFEDAIVIKNVSLKEGKNTIVLKVNNSISLKGTCEATAWLVDCLKIQTVANLTWNPTDNPRPN